MSLPPEILVEVFGTLEPCITAAFEEELCVCDQKHRNQLAQGIRAPVPVRLDCPKHAAIARLLGES